MPMNILWPCLEPSGYIFNVIQRLVHLSALVLDVIVQVHGVQRTINAVHKCVTRKHAIDYLR